MQVLISVDFEGVAGVSSRDGVLPPGENYQRFRSFMTGETNAAIDGALAGGADRIIVNDSHGPATNILIEHLRPGVELISGFLKPLNMMQGLSAETDAVFLIGYHAAAGTGAAVLAHTNSSAVVLETRLNGQPVGELGMNAALAGAYGAPVALVSGDRAVVDEARSLLGEVETVVAKEGITWAAARCLHPQTVQTRIREAAERSLRVRGRPFVVTAPVDVRVAFYHPGHADIAGLVPGARRVDGRTLEWVGSDMLTAHSAYWAMVNLAMLWQARASG